MPLDLLRPIPEQVRTLRHRGSFVGTASLVGGGGSTATVQLLNPIGSNRLLWVRSLDFAISSAGAFELYFRDSALTTLLTSAFNIISGDVAPVAELRQQAVASVVGFLFYQGFILANTSYPNPLVDLPILFPGRGVIIQETSGDGRTLRVNWRWEEIGLPFAVDELVGMIQRGVPSRRAFGSAV